MTSTLHEWLNLALRWAHVVAAIMWIGDSFLFMWLDSHLETPRKKREGDVSGELWMTHSGGFYEVVKRKSLRPEEMPPNLHWFKWESYTTWITGFFLITVVYYLGGQALLVEPGGPLLHAEGVALSIVLLGAGVLFYDLLCRTPLVTNLRLFGVVAVALVMLLAWALHFVFTPRAVFLQVGAMIATIMSSNVLLKIIPAQRHMIAATRAGTPVDTSYGVRAKLRSTHNHYVTLPVLFTMLSNHFPSVYAGPKPWLALGLLAVVGVGVKKFMNVRLKMHPVQIAGTAVALGAVVFLTLPATAEMPAHLAQADKVEFAQVHGIIQSRCVTCHSAAPSNPAFPAPPLGVVLETPAQIGAQKERIYARTVQTKTMPLGNLTAMTDQERDLVAAWVAQGGDTSGGIGMAAVAGATAVPVGAPSTAGGTTPPETTPTPTPVLAATTDAGTASPSAANSGGAVTPAAAAAAAPKPVTKDEVVALYNLRCMICHGQQGDGDGPASASLKPTPRKFSDPAWQKSVTDAHIQKTILEGGGAVGKSPTMPANPDLVSKPEMVSELVKLIRGFTK